MRLISLVIISLCCSVAGVSNAVTLATPFGSGPTGDEAVSCQVTNVGTKPANVTVKVWSLNGGLFVPAGDGCNGQPLAPMTTCSVDLPSHSFGGWCQVVGTGKLRADLFIRDFAFAILLPATAK